MGDGLSLGGLEKYLDQKTIDQLGTIFNREVEKVRPKIVANVEGISSHDQPTPSATDSVNDQIPNLNPKDHSYFV